MNVAENLAREIARVTTVRGQYANMDGMPQVNVKPILFFIDRALEAGKLAAGVNDALSQAHALHELETFE